MGLVYKVSKDIDLCRYRDKLGEELFRDLLERQCDDDSFVAVFDETNAIVGYEEDNELWIAFADRKPDGDLSASRKVFEILKQHARDKNLKAISCMTTRTKVRAFKRFGLKEHAVILKAEL
jgi:hypothetical protein